MLQGRPAASLEHGLHLASAKEYRRVPCKGTSGLWLEGLLRCSLTAAARPSASLAFLCSLVLFPFPNELVLHHNEPGGLGVKGEERAE